MRRYLGDKRKADAQEEKNEAGGTKSQSATRSALLVKVDIPEHAARRVRVFEETLLLQR